MTSSTFQGFDAEVAAGRRFRFGDNWAQFLELLSDERIAEAERSLLEFLGGESLTGKTFLDIGSGSGLFSLAARRLGAIVTSMDYDPSSVDCTASLRERYFAGDSNWTVKRGSVLDEAFMRALPKFDVVYSWGVLHHTGDMHRAIVNAVDRVADGGLLYLAMYRKTWLCPLWKIEKRAYCASPAVLQQLTCRAFGGLVGIAYQLRHPGAVPRRGMDFDRDIADWLGGYPYESITPRALKSLIIPHGFSLRKQLIKSEGVHFTYGCDEFVFSRDVLSRK